MRGSEAEVLISNSSPKEFKKYLTYFQLVGLYHAAPLLYSKTFFDRDNLTERQLAELDAYLQAGSSSVWPELAELMRRFQPMTSGRDEIGALDWDDPGPFGPDADRPPSGTEEIGPAVGPSPPVLPDEQEIADQREAPAEPVAPQVIEETDGQEEFLAGEITASSMVLAPPIRRMLR